LAHMLSKQIQAVMALDPGAPAIEGNGQWHSWGSLDWAASALNSCLSAFKIPRGAPVAVILRNDPAVVAAILGVLKGERCIVSISPSTGDEGLVRELRRVGPSAVVGVEEDMCRSGVMPALEELGVLALRVRLGMVNPVECLGRTSPVLRDGLGDTAIEMLTSGTTGPPKRIRISYEELDRSLRAAGRHYGDQVSSEVRLRSGVAIVSAPLVHMAGMFRTLLNVCNGRRIVLMDRFRTDEFVHLVARHRPKALSIVPASMRMILESDPPTETFESVKVVTSGTAPLPVDLQVAFERRFDVAVLPSYGATEFSGGVAGWTLSLYEEWAERKRGSVGRVQPGREIRIVTSSGDPVLRPGTQGQIEVRTAGGEWVRTTDFGRVDDDRFVWIDGRSDDAIIRGGFKVLPSEIVDALRLHPAVLDAGATGIPDARLGAVPVAAVEIKHGYSPTVDELLLFLRSALPPYKVPARLLVVASLPRTSSLKVDQSALRSVLNGLEV
jgi:long-chain acyl-CoA synthetase